jgi:gluconolactonase
VSTLPLDRLAAGYGLLEAARWYPETGLVFSDMTRGGVHRLDPSVSPAEPEVLIPHRKGIGGLVRHADGGFVLAGRNIAHKTTGRPTQSATGCASNPLSGTLSQPVAVKTPGPTTSAGETSVLLETAGDEQFFNDLTADGRGRLYVGSVGTDPAPGSGAARPNGRLYRLDLDGTMTVLADDVLVSNGLGTDPADETLYHVDSPRRVVWRIPLDTDHLGDGREVFVDTSEYTGVPDGLTVAADGSVWVAMAGGGVVVAWDAKGARVTEIPVPQPLVTSVTFGGPDLRSLFILTGHNHDHPDADGGCLYRTNPGRAGLPAPRAGITACR